MHRLASVVACALLFAHCSALPIHIGFVFLRPDAAAVTEGCTKKTCCTALCYVDKNGVHHCVHPPGESCECGLSKNEVEKNPMLLSVFAILPQPPHWLPTFVLTGCTVYLSHPVVPVYPATPDPPPRILIGSAQARSRGTGSLPL